jgi:hypothetical protein
VTGAGWGRWSPFLAGAALGLLAGVVLGRTAGPGDGSTPAPDGDEERRSRWRETWDAAVDGASGRLAAARSLVAGPSPDLDVAALEGRVTGMACAGGCKIRLLGDGIVEVVGDCASEDDARALLDAVAGEPGVEVVVNRVWTPASGGPVEETG